MIGFYNYTVVLTYVGLISTMFGMFSAGNGQPALAVICLIIAGICDMFDGKIARTMKRTKDECRFGIQIDSLCDLTSFGVLPVMIGFSLTGYKLSYAIVYSFYTLAAVIRLAYYNVTEENRQDTEAGERQYYEGLPVTNIAIIVPLLFILKRFLRISDGLFGIIYGVMILIVGCLFIIGFKVKKHPFRDLLDNESEDIIVQENFNDKN